MDEPVGALPALDQLLADGLPQRRVDVRLRCPENERQKRDLGGAAETSKLVQGRLSFGREARELADHEVHHIVGVPLGANALEVPAPAGAAMIEGEQVRVGKRVKELNDEERVPGRFLVHKSRKRCGASRLATKRLRDQLCEMPMGKRRERDLLYLPAAGQDGVELAPQRMSGIDLVVPIGADQQQVPQIRLGQKVLEQVECSRVEPLQIVEEQCQGMFRPREHANELPEYPLETPLGRLWREFGDRRLCFAY